MLWFCGAPAQKVGRSGQGKSSRDQASCRQRTKTVCSVEDESLLNMRRKRTKRKEDTPSTPSTDDVEEDAD